MMDALTTTPLCPFIFGSSSPQYVELQSGGLVFGDAGRCAIKQGVAMAAISERGANICNYNNGDIGILLRVQGRWFPSGGIKHICPMFLTVLAKQKRGMCVLILTLKHICL